MHYAAVRVLGMLLLIAVISGCGSLRNAPPTVTPIIVTATADQSMMPIVATETPTPVMQTADVSMLPTQGPTSTATVTTSTPAPITMTPTFTPTATDTPVTPDAQPGYLPVGGVAGEPVSGGCAVAPQGGFGNIYQGDAAIQTALGCPLTGATAGSSAYQPFQNGVMFWVSSLGSQPQPVIYALFNNGTYQRFNDTFVEGVDPSSGGATPPEGLIEPVRGFGKVWRDSAAVHDTLGWATAGESGGSVQVQVFERGEMIYISQTGQTYILVTGAPGTWSARTGGP